MKTLEQPSHVSTNFQYMPYLKVKLKILLIASEMSQIKNVHYWDEKYVKSDWFRRVQQPLPYSLPRIEYCSKTQDGKCSSDLYYSIFWKTFTDQKSKVTLIKAM